MNKKADDFVNQWGAFGKTMMFYRWLSLISVMLAIAAVTALVVFFNRNPLVVAMECEKKHFYMAQRLPVAIEGQDVEMFTKSFIRAFYGKNEHECTMTQGLENKLKKLKETRKKINQYVGRIEVVLQEKLTLASFDLIMNIENVPIAVRKEVGLQIIQGKKTACNPLGLYVNGIGEKGSS